MSKVKLKKYLTEYSARNKDGVDYPVYSVTNSSGFCTEYFTKDVSSSDKTNYKIVPFGYFAYNPSRINVGSIDCQEAEEMVIVSPLYNVFKCSESLDRHYLKYFFKSRYGNNLINANTSGSVRANLKFKTLCEFEISDRTLKEQKEAVNLFETINKSIDNEKRILFLLDELIKSRFNEMFSEKRNIVSLKDLTTKITDGSHNPPKGINESKYIMASSQNVFDKLDLTNVRYLTKEDFELENKRTNVQDGDVLFTIVGTIGRTHVIKNEQLVFQRSVAVIKPKRDLINPIYLKNALSSEYVLEQINKSAHGVAQMGIYLSDLKELRIKLPSISEQNEFAIFVEQIDKLKFNVQKRIDFYQELLNKKMDEYFN